MSRKVADASRLLGIPLEVPSPAVPKQPVINRLMAGCGGRNRRAGFHGAVQANNLVSNYFFRFSAIPASPSVRPERHHYPSSAPALSFHHPGTIRSVHSRGHFCWQLEVVPSDLKLAKAKWRTRVSRRTTRRIQRTVLGVQCLRDGRGFCQRQLPNYRLEATASAKHESTMTKKDILDALLRELLAEGWPAPRSAMPAGRNARPCSSWHAPRCIAYASDEAIRLGMPPCDAVLSHGCARRRDEC